MSLAQGADGVSTGVSIRFPAYSAICFGRGVPLFIGRLFPKVEQPED